MSRPVRSRPSTTSPSCSGGSNASTSFPKTQGCPVSARARAFARSFRKGRAAATFPRLRECGASPEKIRPSLVVRELRADVFARRDHRHHPAEREDEGEINAEGKQHFHGGMAHSQHSPEEVPSPSILGGEG